jgi:DNA-binding MarR family transcriptional regulator
MKKIITGLNKQFDNMVRLGIMSVLMVNDWVDFNTLKEKLDLTDGRLASHIKALEKAEYLKVKKQFIGRKPNTSYAATAQGKKAFSEHLDALEKIIKSTK